MKNVCRRCSTNGTPPQWPCPKLPSSFQVPVQPTVDAPPPRPQKHGAPNASRLLAHVFKNVSTPAQAYLEKLKVTSEYHSRPCAAACIRRHCKICKGSDLTTELPTSEIFCDPQSTEFRLTCTRNQASRYVPLPPPPSPSARCLVTRSSLNIVRLQC